ncbi:MAG: RluA family pseudouridine synthase [bacterium]|nr:RluA family pseudouridine synthase [bacterium]MDZ4296349.1 RluA family pseudouridine synthase [Patescibacteria group bacterium]
MLPPEPRILYEDDAIIVLDKPAGLLVHALERGIERTLVDWVLGRWPEVRRVGASALRPGIVHRLDKDTSGLIVIAKTNESFQALKQAFQLRVVEKRYLALVSGVMSAREGVVDLPIGHGQHAASKRTVRRLGRGVRGEREALTRWKVNEEFAAAGERYTLVEVTPKTGRTHQIRVHLAAIGHPVAGDRLYGFRRAKPVPGLTRQFLHAAYLSFALPDGKRFAFESELPEDLKAVLGALRAGGGLQK